MDLPMNHHRIDHHTDIVHSDHPLELQTAGRRIDLDLADVTTAGKRPVQRVVESSFVEARLERLDRKIMQRIRGPCNVAKGNRSIGTGDPELASLELDVARSSFHSVRRDLPPL